MVNVVEIFAREFVTGNGASSSSSSSKLGFVVVTLRRIFAMGRY
jgi:hypothetical protein